MNKANFFWSGSPLLPQQICALKSFLHHGWDVTFWSLTEKSVEIPGVNVRDANEVLDGSRLGAFRYETCYVDEVVFSDLFRLYVMKHTGGWWFDIDCFCLVDQFHFNNLSYGRNFVACWEVEGTINNSILYFPDQQLLEDYINYVESKVEPVMSWATIGPVALTDFMTMRNLENQALPNNLFYPITWPDAKKSIEDEYTEEIREKSKHSLTYHWYNSICNLHEFRGYVRELMNKYGGDDYGSS
jgi:mannosyltransferase OCH1-like enzyme